MRHIPAHRKALLVVLLLLVTGMAQFASIVGQPETHRSSDHCCLLCHVGPLPFLEASATAAVSPVFEIAWLTPAADVAATHDFLLPSSAARAPPIA
jgi:hypothetical protein